VTVLLAAINRSDIANYVSWLFYVYIIIIFVYVLLNLLFSTGVHPPFSRFTDAILTFLRDTTEPYLRLFRRVLPSVGAFDFSPMIGIIVLYLLRTIIVNAIS
jgi:YggT family protein